ncbi:MAG: hypothetical protein JRE40_02035 [Deltaproteobacteria bacterium]|nr:hypothetical protein [Deltaproteobacteria bacterium]MBW2672531.1 hypothetical protein [Deltaproteobacteria bacterium]
MTTVPCLSCRFPIATSGVEGDSVTCPACGTKGILTRISAVVVPDPLFFGFLGFGFGMVLGPALKKAIERLGK